MAFKLTGLEPNQNLWSIVKTRVQNECNRFVKHPQKVMVWGCFSHYGVGELCVINSIVNTTVYLEIMDMYFLSSVESFPDDDFICQQDNAPSHTSKRAKQHFRENNIQL